MAVFAPEPVGFPGVDVAIWVKCGDENPIEFLEERGHGFGFAVGGNKGVGDVVDGAGADPFARMGAAGDNDCFAGRGRFFGIGGMDSDAKGGDIAAFVRNANIDHAHMGGEEGLEEAHPGDYDGEGLVVLEKDIGLGVRGPQSWAEGLMVFLGWSGRIHKGVGWV